MSRVSDDSSRETETSASGVLTSWTITDVALVAYAGLPGPISWPLLVTPLTTEFEPTSTLLTLIVSSGPGAVRSVNRLV